MKTTVSNMEEENIQSNASKINKQDSLINFYDVEGTPFRIVEEEEKYFGVLGMNRLTETYFDITEVEKELKEINWNRIIQVIYCINKDNILKGL